MDWSRLKATVGNFILTKSHKARALYSVVYCSSFSTWATQAVKKIKKHLAKQTLLGFNEKQC